jgi:phosphate transport system substrate-binding protein
MLLRCRFQKRAVCCQEASPTNIYLSKNLADFSWLIGQLTLPLVSVCFLLSCCLLAGVTGCGRNEARNSICVAGSTSVQPLAEKLAEVYMSTHPEIRIDVQGGGSSAGIFAAQQGAADLGASSRELTPPEKALQEIPIAYDGIAIIVHKQNPLNNLTVNQIRQIFQGDISDWRQFNLPPHPIHIITREEGSGTRNAFEELVMGTHAEITPLALVQDSNGSVRELVASDPNAIGYISMGLVDARIKAVSVDGIAPNRENIKNRQYQLVRRFLLVTKNLKPGPCQAWVNFILSPQGQRLLESEGLVGVKD